VISRRRALLLLASLMLIWGANWPILKLGVRHIPPLWLAADRMILAGLVLAAIQAVSGGLRLPPRRTWPLLASIGLLQIGVFNICMNLALLHVEAGRSAILAYTTPLWVAPGAVLLLREPLGRLGVAGVALGLAGVVALFNPATFAWDDHEALIGNALLLLAALSWAVAILHVRASRDAPSPLAVAPWTLLVAGVPLTILALVREGAPPLGFDGYGWFVLAYNVFPATAFGIWAAITVQRAVPAVISSLSFLGVPVCGLLLSSWWLDEALTVGKLVGLGLILCGVAVVTMAGVQRRR
jgi:drug/metabolite transporter (DMT)-like permease